MSSSKEQSASNTNPKESQVQGAGHGPLLPGMEAGSSPPNVPSNRGHKGMYTAVRQMLDPQYGRPITSQPDVCNDVEPNPNGNGATGSHQDGSDESGFGVYPVDTVCPNCHEEVTTLVDKEMRDQGWLFCILCCCCLSWLVGILACFMNGFK